MSILPAVVYLLCFATSLACVALLVRSFIRGRQRLLFWTALAFVGLAANNLLLFADLVILPTTDLLAFRHLCNIATIAVLLYGFIWETD
jgi:hypothetical protein